MRFTRLRRAIEDGTLVGTHGKQFQGCAAESTPVRRKRKRKSSLEPISDGSIEHAFCSRPIVKGVRRPSNNSRGDCHDAPTLTQLLVKPVWVNHVDSAVSGTSRHRAMDAAGVASHNDLHGISHEDFCASPMFTSQYDAGAWQDDW